MTDYSKYRCEQEEVVCEDWCKVEPFVTASWGHV